METFIMYSILTVASYSGWFGAMLFYRYVITKRGWKGWDLG